MLCDFQQGTCPPCPTSFNLAEHVLTAGAATPDKIALAVLQPFGAERWSFGRLRQAILGTGTGLLEYGLNPGDKLLMRLGNTVDFPIVFLGAIAAGIVPVPTSAQLSASDVRRMCDTLSPKAVVRGAGVPCPDELGRQIDVDTLGAWRRLPAAAFVRGDPNRLAYIVYTSGTSGQPRAVMHAHRAVWARKMMTEGWYALTPQDRVCHAGAFNWTFTLGSGLLDPWTRGATALMLGADVTLDQIPLLLRRNEASIFAAVPGVYRRLLGQDLSGLRTLRHGISAGEKLPDSLRRAWRDQTGTEIYEAFGMSECSTFISGHPGRPARDGALGVAQDGRRIAIVGTDGPVMTGETGVIAVHRSDPGLTLGYLGAEADTKACFQGDWFLTGDLGRMDPDGQVHYLGRSDDMMNAGGFRVSPLEVERALAEFPGLNEIGVTEVEVKPHVRVIAAFYTCDDSVSQADLDAFVARSLPRYKQPRIMQKVAAIPRNPNGKLLRKALPPLWQGKN